ncbi:MAG TPA: phosphoribosylglycinamide formyltransferase [Stellaceae bacterium]|jgi:phosphoribosylglycinamide formyltransferase-1|nr:phosphoribosylglycinamide formyltransferase [Stellaceae bacterium]
MRLGFLASHSGSGMRAILTAIAEGRLDARGQIAISNNAEAPALASARAAGLATCHISARTSGSVEAADQAIATALDAAGVELVVLSGYMRKIGPALLSRFRNRILNIHPSLLPKHGGEGMYGARVHAAVVAGAEAESGATIHLVDEIYDHGLILAQSRVSVLPTDTAEDVEAKVRAVEPDLYVETLRRIIAGEIALP